MSARPVPGSVRAGAIAPDRRDLLAARPDELAGEASRELGAALRARLRGRVAIMGIGNPWRGDDGVGCRVARRLLDARPPLSSPATSAEGGLAARGITVVDAEEIPESYLDVVEAARPDVVLLIDAADLGGAPGSVVLVEGARLSDQTVFTHRTPLAPLARYLERSTGAAVVLVGIQPGRLELGDAVTPDVAATADHLVTLLLDALRPAEAAAAPSAARTPEARPC